MHKLSSIISKPVFSLFEGLWVGTISDICLNAGKIKGFFVLSSDEESTSFIAKKDIHKIGDEFVAIRNVDKLSFVNCESLNLINKRAITFDGQDLGKINEVFFDDKLNVLSVETNFGILLPNEKIASVGQDAVVFALDRKVKISTFKPKQKIFSKDVKNLKVSILEDTRSQLSIIEDTNDNMSKSVYIPKKIMQNPNFLIGRTAINLIKTDSGEVIIKAGEKISERTISKAKIHNKIYELSSCANWS